MNSLIEKKILHVIVIYNAPLEDCQTYRTFLKFLGEKDFIFIWDNSALKHDISITHSTFEYVHCPENKGVSEAYNQACKYALENNFQFLLLLDQDTIFPADAISEYHKMLEILSENSCAIPEIYSAGQRISPFCIKNLKPTKMSNKTEFNQPLESGQYSAINSGVLVMAKAIQNSNYFNPRLKLDWSDVDFFLRFQGHLLRIPIKLTHRLSIHEKRSTKTKLNRFRYYCEGAKEMAEVHNGFFRLGYISLRHGIKLCITSFSFGFIVIWLNYFLGNKTTNP